jgi:hypothetical protein
VRELWEKVPPDEAPGRGWGFSFTARNVGWSFPASFFRLPTKRGAATFNAATSSCQRLISKIENTSPVSESAMLSTLS